MRHRRPGAVAGNRTSSDEKGSLIDVEFLGSFPTAAFAVTPPLPEIAIVGRSNVGKSSLINALLLRKGLAHTSKTPGKTRLLNVFQVAGSFNLVDFPGYGFARVSQKEREGFKRLYRDYFSSRDALAGVIWLLDVRRDPSPEDLEMGGLIASASVPVLIAVTKADKLPTVRRTERVAALAEQLGMPEDQFVLTSSVKKLGIDDLRDSVLAFLAKS